MTSYRAVRTAVRQIFYVGAVVTTLGFAPVAVAQNEEPLEEIVVTGSHIKRDTFNYSTPITVIGEQEISATGTTNLGDLLQTLPQSVSTINNANSAFFTTFSGLNLTDLRFLGPERTLVLVNGRRFVSGTPPGGGYGVDLNSIPTGMIERIEVLTGGASAIYGSDAIAGVVNIITKTDFEGVDIDLQVGASTEGDKNKEDLSITIGGEFGDGGFGMLSVGYSDDEALRSRDRDFSAFDTVFADQDGDGFGETVVFLGSSFPPQGRLNPPGAGPQFNGDGSVFQDPTTAAGPFGTPDVSDRFNRASFRTIFNPVERRFAAANASYPVSEKVTAFTEVNWSTVHSDSEIEPFALSINDDIFQFSRGGNFGFDVQSNLLMPQALKDSLAANLVTNTNQLGTGGWVRRLVEFGPRASQIDRTTTRGLAGVDVEITENWDLSAYVSYGRTEQNQENTGQINLERAALAMDVQLNADDGVTIECANELARIQGCVPFNVFGAGTITPAAVRYLQAPGNLKTVVEQEIYHLGVSGNLGWDLPGGSVAVAGGFEYREETGAEINPGFNQTGIGGGNATAPTNGTFDVTEFYGEIVVPIWDQLSLDAAVRVGDYSTVGNQTTWKAGFDAALHETFRLRGTISESVRAPNVSDLFAGAGETFANVNDPCDTIDNTTTGNVATNCRSIQVIQDRIDAQGSFTLTQPETQGTGGFIGGNPFVNEETADAFTFGIVWQPTFFNEGFSAAIDYYDIEIDDGIATTSRNTVLNRCYDVDPAQFDPVCGIGLQPGGRARRDMRAGAGNLTGVDSGTSNENRFETSGIDIELAYGMEVGPGTLDAALVWNHLLAWDEIGIADGDLDENAGEILTPDNRATGRLTYTVGDWTAFWRARYWDRSKDSNTPELQNENSCICASGLAPSANEVASYVYNDFSVSYNQESYSIRLGINNAFDKQPPLLPQITQFGNTGTNTVTEAYDTIGAAWYLAFNYNTN